MVYYGCQYIEHLTAMPHNTYSERLDGKNLINKEHFKCNIPLPNNYDKGVERYCNNHRQILQCFCGEMIVNGTCYCLKHGISLRESLVSSASVNCLVANLSQKEIKQNRNIANSGLNFYCLAEISKHLDGMDRIQFHTLFGTDLLDNRGVNVKQNEQMLSLDMNSLYTTEALHYYIVYHLLDNYFDTLNESTVINIFRKFHIPEELISRLLIKYGQYERNEVCFVHLFIHFLFIYVHFLYIFLFIYFFFSPNLFQC